MTPMESLVALATIYLGITAYSSTYFGASRIYAVTEGFFVGAMCLHGVISTYSSLKATCFDVLAKDILVVIPMVIGLAAFTRLSRYRWAARYPTSILSGIGVGTTLGLILRTDILTGVRLTITGVAAGKPDALSSIIILVGMISVVAYFLFSLRYSKIVRTGPLRYVATLGSWYLMLSFGRNPWGAPTAFILEMYRTIASLFGITV